MRFEIGRRVLVPDGREGVVTARLVDDTLAFVSIPATAGSLFDQMASFFIAPDESLRMPLGDELLRDDDV